MEKIKLRKAKRKPLPESKYNFESMDIGIEYDMPTYGNAIAKRKTLSVTKCNWVKKARLLGYDIDFKVWREGRKVFIKRLK